MAEGDTVEFPAISCTSDDHNVEFQSDFPLAKVNPSSVAELKLRDIREPLNPPQSDSGITPIRACRLFQRKKTTACTMAQTYK